MLSKRVLSVLAAALSVIVLAAVLSACGSSSSTESTTAGTEASGEETAAGGGGGIGEAEALVSEQLEPIKWVPPGPAFEPKPEFKGPVYLVPNTLEEYWLMIKSGLEDAAGLYHAEVVAGDAEGKTADAAREIRQAIGRKASAIIIGSLETKALAAPLKEAADAGIPIIAMFDQEEGPVSPAQEELGIYGNVGTCNSCAGEVLAAQAVVESGGEVNAVSITFPEIPPAHFQSKGFVEGLTKFCPECKGKEVGLPLAEVSTQLGPVVSAALAEPEVNYLVPVFSFMVGIMTPSINAAGAADRVNVLSQGAEAELLKLVQNGQVGAIVGTPIEWYGWAAFDQVLRAVSGQPPAEESLLPTRLFSAENIKSVDVSGSQNSWFGLDYQGKFEELWGLKG